MNCPLGYEIISILSCNHCIGTALTGHLDAGVVHLGCGGTTQHQSP
jgi:hypothetical protein